MLTCSALLSMESMYEFVFGYFFISISPTWIHSVGQPFPTPDVFSLGSVRKIHPTFFYDFQHFLLPLYWLPFFLSLHFFRLWSLILPLSFCLNLLPLMSPSRESEAWKKGSGLTEIDVWALPLIRWLNPSINMQRRCPMQMDPIRQNGGVVSGVLWQAVTLEVEDGALQLALSFWGWGLQEGDDMVRF